jgi:hypothetical protein
MLLACVRRGVRADNQRTAMRVHISDPRCLATLIDDLVRGGCVPAKVDETVEVVHPAASDADEAWTELRFFLRAWQSRHPQVVVKMTAA